MPKHPRTSLAGLLLAALCLGSAAGVVSAHEINVPMADAGAGVVSFSNTGAAAAQADFQYGVAQLHNFQYEQAAEAFRRAQKIDPGFAMAYWGEAMTYNHTVWARQDLDEARAALAKLAATPEQRLARAGSQRERDFLHSLDLLYGEGSKHDRDRRYALALEAMHAKYPDDIDLTCFYALALLGTADAGRDVPTYMRSAALMQEVFEHHPRHPGAAHYLIHSVDDAVHAPLGLRAARAYGQIAPASAHAQHMTSHIYLAMGMWDDTVKANLAAIGAVDRRIRAGNPAARLPACGHSHNWLNYAYLQQGRLDQARRMVEACAAEAGSHPMQARIPLDALDSDGTSAGSLAAMRADYLVNSKDWQGAVAALARPEVGPTLTDFYWDYADAYVAARQGKADPAATQRARSAAAQMAAQMDKLEVPASHPMRRVPAILLAELDGLAQLQGGASEQALATLTAAAQQESQLKMEFGPPAVSKPANELLGEVLLQLGRAAEARTAFEAAGALGPGRTATLQGLAECAKALGDKELLQSVNAKLAQIRQQAQAGS